MTPGLLTSVDFRRGAVLAAAALLVSQPVSADVPRVRISPDSELRFGSFMVFGSGARTVSATGLVSDQAIVPIEGSTTGPARFTISYDRGNESKQSLDIEIELVISNPGPVRAGGVDARLSAFETDLPGALRVTPGQAIRLSIRNCSTRVCSRSFQVGARLDVARQFGGADLSVPIPLDATIISAERVR